MNNLFNTIRFNFRLIAYTIIFVFALFVTLGLEQLSTVADRLDSRQHIDLKIMQQDYVFKQCDPIIIYVNAISSVTKSVDATFVASHKQKNQFINLAHNGNEINHDYYTRKENMQPPRGEITFGSIAFNTNQTCNWQPGEYRISLQYSYVYRITPRNFSTATIVVISN